MKKYSIIFLFLFCCMGGALHGQNATNGLNTPFVDINIRGVDGNQETALTIQIILLLAVIALSPSIILLTTSFLRISIVFEFIKRALSLQQVPPTQIILGVSLFLTLFVMWPTFSDIYDNSFKPFANGEINISQMYTNAEKPLRNFMFNQIDNSKEGRKNIELFLGLSGVSEQPKVLADIPTYVLVPAFILNELRIAFMIAIALYIPFIIIDMVVSSVLMSMGMIMLPPVMISLPFKLLLFVMVDGWSLLTRNVVQGFM